MLMRVRSIRSKLNIIVALTTVTALVAVALPMLALYVREHRIAVEQDILTQAEVIALSSAPALTFSDRRVAAENLAVLRGKPSLVAAALYDEDGALFATYMRDAPRAGERAVLPVQAQAPRVAIDGDWAVAWHPVVKGSESLGTLYLQMRHDGQRLVLEYLGMLVLTMGASLGAALLLSNRLQRSVTRPILDVSEVAHKILHGENLQMRARRSSIDEVGALVDAFNAMLDELDQRARTLQAANRALHESEARYHLAVRGSSAGLWDWDMRGGSMFYAPRFKDLLGYKDAQLRDRPSAILPLLYRADRAAVLQALRAHLHEGAPFQVECRIRTGDGSLRWFFVAGAAIWDDETHRPCRMAGSLVDVTERKEAEQVLQTANRAKDEFLATLAHELRNPLAPIRSGLDILNRDKGNGPASERARATMERQLRHMVRLIDDLLDISRINSGKIKLETLRLHLRPVVDSALEISRPAMASGAHTLHVDMPEDVEMVGDFTRLAQAFGNLLTNAAKYTPSGGRIAVRVRREGADHVLIEVQDSGEGIPPDMLEKVFSLFAQVRDTQDRSQGGLGIGLYLVRSLVGLHGGTVFATSPGQGQGSTFTVRLPCLPAHVPPAMAAPPALGGPAAAGLKVLLVDDNVDAAETLSAVLEMGGSRTHMVHDGPQAIQAAREFNPDVVLLDIGLPGMSGYDVARRLRVEPLLSGTLLVAVTGWGAEQDRRRSREAGFDHHLTKPVDLQVLETLLQDLGRDLALRSSSETVGAGVMARGSSNKSAPL